MEGRIINIFSTIFTKRAVLTLVFLVFTLIISISISNDARAQAVNIDTCPGNNTSQPYTCQASDDFTNGTINAADDRPCTDVSGMQSQIVTCYPDDVYGGIRSLCNTNESRTDGCDGGVNSQYTCQSSDFRSCRDVTNFDTGGCGSIFSGGVEFNARDLSCYPNDYYSGLQNIPDCAQYDNVVSCDINNICVKNDSSLCIIPAKSCDLNPAGPEWTALYKPSSGGAAYGYATAVDSVGNVYVVGEEFNAATGLDMYLRKYSSAGNVLWTRTYDAGSGGNESGYSVAVDSAGDVYAVGRQDAQNVGDSISLADMFIRKYDTAGNVLWIQTSGRAGADLARSVAIDSSGNVYAAGYEQNASGNNIDAVIWQFNSNGNFLNAVSYDVGGNESAYGITLDPNNNIYITGYQSTGGGDMFLAKYDSAFGLPQWVGVYDSTPVDIDTTVSAQTVCIDENIGMIYETSGTTARVYISGTSPSWSGYQWFYGCGDDPGYWNTNNGKVLFYEFDWSNIPADTNSLTVTADDVNSSCSQTISINRNTASGTKFLGSGCYGSSGQQTPSIQLIVDWPNAASYTDIGRGTTVSKDGDTIFVTGYQSSNGGDMFIRAYDATNGSLRWNEVYNSGGTQSDVGRAVVAGSANRTYVSGHQETNNNDTFLREYFSSAYQGFLQQALSAINAGNEMAYGIAIDSSTSSEPLYITGYQSSNGGEAFLSKYSCNASAAGGSVTASGKWATLSVAPATTGNAPFTITATGNVTIPDPVSYAWNWGDGETSTGQIATHTYRNTTGATINPILTLTVQNLTVASESDIATTTMTIMPDVAPTAGFSATPMSGTAPLLVRVNSTSTDVSPGKIISYEWNWGDGTAPGYGAQTSHIYTNAGTYTVTLAVADDGGMPTSTASRIINVTWACTGYSGPEGSCASPDPVCAPGNKCVECLADYDCGVGSRCTGTLCKKGDLCPDGNECPIDGKCAETDTSGAPVKNTCVLSSDSLGANCYIEEIPSSCVNDLECAASVMGGKCDMASGNCLYARCLNESSVACERDSNCAGGDGICDANVCKYIYDCAYGPGMGGGTIGRYATATPPVIPAMPVGPQPEGQACTQPTPDAPINCQGINGCLYYNFDSDGNPVQNSNNSVANCLDKFNGGTGCVYYQYYSTSTITQATKANCLASPDGIVGAKKRNICILGTSCADGQTCPTNGVCLATPVTAGVPDGCIQIARGKDSKGNITYDYNCSSIDGCYYKSDGGIDCTYTDGVPQPGGISGNGCIYEPNPEGAIFCPGATKPVTSGENYVQCLLNPDATLPWYLRDRTATTTQACKTNADCPAGNICIDGACFPECQGDLNCATGQSCVQTCNTVYDCPSDSYICDGVCTLCPPGDLSCTQAVPLCSGAQPRGNLPFGTSATTISMQTNQDATCRYSTIAGTPYVAMTESFGATSTTHSVAVSGLMPLPSINTYYVECQTTAGDITPACRIEFGVGEPCAENSQCDGGLSCINGYCQLPYCDGAQPPPGAALPSNIASVNIGLNTDNPAVCRYSQTLPDSLSSRLDRYLGMPTLFDTIDGLIHTDTVTSNLVTGNNSYYALCQETAPPQNITPLCQISFNIGVCNEEFKCANGWLCEPNVGNGICVPPPCSNVSVLPAPDANNTLPATTTSVTLQATTDEPANCAYSNSRSDVFSAMTGFLTTGGLAHTAGNVSVNGGYNTKYVKCQDADGEDICSVSFRVGQQCGVNGVCPSGLECRNGACLYPICENAYPTNLDFNTTSATMGLTTNIDAECRYSRTTSDFNLQTAFANTGGQAHSTDVADLTSRLNRYIVDCRDNALPNKIRTCEIPIYVGSCVSSWDCEAGYGCNLGTNVCETCDTNPDLPECQSWCQRFPWLCDSNPLCTPGVDCPINTEPPSEGASCSFMGITFFGDAVDEDGTCDFLAMILAVISWMAWLVALLAVLSGLRAAYLYITAMGNEKRLTLARSYLIYTTIGVVVALVSFGLVAIVRALMGI